MSRTLTLELDERVYAALAEKAGAAGSTPDQLAAAVLAQRFLPTPPEGPKTADIRKFFGCVRVGHPSGLDNEAIDADLAREYGRGLDGRDE
jgi:hypothetical protein